MYGSISLAVVCVLGMGLKTWSRYERRQEREAAREAQMLEQYEAEHPVEVVDTTSQDFLGYAHELMGHAPDYAINGAYLNAAVDTHHVAVFDRCGKDSLKYRDELLSAMFAQANAEGRKDIAKTIERLRMASSMVGPQWWALKKRG
jgi:hypothetical protein